MSLANAARAVAIKVRTFAGSLRPAAASTPETTSTPQGFSDRNGFGYIVGGKSAGDDKLMGVFEIAEETGGGGIPVEGDAGAPNGAVAVRESTRSASIFLSDAREAACAAMAGLKCSVCRIRRLGPKLARNCDRIAGCRCKLQLNSGELAGANGRLDLCKGCVDEDSDFFDCGGEVRNDSGDLRSV